MDLIDLPLARKNKNEKYFKNPLKFIWLLQGYLKIGIKTPLKTS